MSVREQIEPLRLAQGDRLSQAEFHRRYERRPDLNKAELIDGLVFLESPIRYRAHGRPHSEILHWLKSYSLATPGTIALGNVTLILDDRNELEPDCVLFLSPQFGGKCQPDPNDYLRGSPELVVEISASTTARDYGPKLAVYLKHQVQEVIIWRTENGILDWFLLNQAQYHLQKPGSDGLLRSRAFPGLFLHSPSLITGDLNAVLHYLQLGLNSPSHRDFPAHSSSPPVT